MATISGHIKTLAEGRKRGTKLEPQKERGTQGRSQDVAMVVRAVL